MSDAAPDVFAIDEAAIAAIVALVARTYPRGGNQIEAAARMAARLGWTSALAYEAQRS